MTQASYDAQLPSYDGSNVAVTKEARGAPRGVWACGVISDKTLYPVVTSTRRGLLQCMCVYTQSQITISRSHIL